MIESQLLRVLGWVWAIFGVYWIAAARQNSAEKTSESPLYRILRLSILALTFLLLFAKWTAVGFLGRNFFSTNSVIAYLGFALAILGMVTATWARIHLGKYWSDKVVLKVDHKLVRTGPYAYMRHPIYSGVLLGVAGSALLLNQWRGILAFAILLTNYTIKARREDHILANAFSASFPEHKRNAGFLLPRMHLKK